MQLRKFLPKILVVLLLSFAVLTLKSGGASATNYNVASGLDVLAGENGICTLSEAISNINDGANTYTECGAPTGNDVITLPNQPITLSADLPVSSNAYSVAGQGKSTSIVDGAGFGGMFRIVLTGQTSSESIYFRDFTGQNVSTAQGNACISLSNGTQGLNPQDSFQQNTLEVTNVNLSNCGQLSIATSIPNSSAVINGVEITSDNDDLTMGIFILRIATIVIKNSTVTGQTVGVHTFQTPNTPVGTPSTINVDIDILNSTITGNEVGTILAASNSGNVEGDTIGRVINMNLNLVNNTIIGNSTTSGAGYWQGLGTSGLQLITNGDPHTSLIMKNNLIANNTYNSSLKNCYVGTSQVSGNVSVTSNKNLSDDNCASKLGVNDFTNVAGVSETVDVLSNNGGVVRTMALLIGSPALDQGENVTDVTIDARGIDRPQNAVYDIGAYEKTAENTPDPDPEPEDPNNPGPPGSTPDNPGTPGVPRTGKLIGAFLASLSIIALLVLVSKEMIDGRIKINRSSK